MGNLVVFRRQADPVSLEIAKEHYSAAPASNKLPETVPAECRQNVRGKPSTPWAVPDVFKRFGLTRFAREPVPTGGDADRDGFLLVLLADQELTAGRDSQALTLLDAAYAAFDRQAHCLPGRVAQQR